MCGNEIKWFCVLQVLMLVLIAWLITTLKLGSRSSDIMTLFKIPVDCQQMYTWSLLIKHSNHFHNPPTAHQQFMQTQGLTVQVGVYSNKLVFVFGGGVFSFFFHFHFGLQYHNVFQMWRVSHCSWSL